MERGREDSNEWSLTAKVQELALQVDVLKRKLEAKELINAELKESLKEFREGKVDQVKTVVSVEAPEGDVDRWKGKLEAKAVCKLSRLS
jgi:hypothetical protein